MELTGQGMVSYGLKTAYRDGTTGRQSDTCCSSGAALRRWIGTRSLHGQTGSTGAQASDEPNGAAEARFHGVLSRGGLPSNSRYRESVTAQSVRKVEPASADVEADGREEPNPGAGRGKGLCCWSTRAAARELLGPTRAAGGRRILHKQKRRVGRWLRVRD